MVAVRAGSKLWIAVVAAVLALGLAACGGDDDSDSSTTESASQAGSTGGSDRKGANGSGTTADSKDSGEDGSTANNDGGGGESAGDDSGSGNFVPKQHEDSGGGSQQYIVKGGDNSVQEFGVEADDSEREAAATALHNFLDARAVKDWEAACSYLAANIRQALENFGARAQKARGGGDLDTSCASILEKLTNPSGFGALREEAANADVGSLRVEGDRAFVIYRGSDDTVLSVPMANEDGDWKVAGLAGSPLN
jgi:hypothetical protein